LVCSGRDGRRVRRACGRAAGDSEAGREIRAAGAALRVADLRVHDDGGHLRAAVSDDNGAADNLRYYNLYVQERQARRVIHKYTYLRPHAAYLSRRGMRRVGGCRQRHKRHTLS